MVVEKGKNGLGKTGERKKFSSNKNTFQETGENRERTIRGV